MCCAKGQRITPKQRKVIGMRSRLHQVTDWPKLAESSGYSIKELARSCKTSLRQLERFFRQTFGKSPQDWMNELRQEKAKHLMESGCFVKEAAAQLGYKQPAHFSREFKRYHGIPPTAAMAAVPSSPAINTMGLSSLQFAEKVVGLFLIITETVGF
jgi:AraC-like DNA-binding protein